MALQECSSMRNFIGVTLISGSWAGGWENSGALRGSAKEQHSLICGK